ncbi:MAG: tRNA (N(6)-L-threonylcarbamoyladenosine(37)-C(2))-methylthiotransferase MtaB [Spirochaetota bacterium]
MEQTVAFYTLGCRLNIFETDGLTSGFQKLGYTKVPLEENPGVIVINTCTVTNRADSKNRNIIRSAIKRHPGSQVWVTGCYAETDKEVIEKIPGVTGVVGNSLKSGLPALVAGQTSTTSSTENRFAYSDVLPQGHTRAYLKIQDGCNRVCSYCKIPQARGVGVSRGFQDVLEQVRFLQDQGVGEIILTGVNLGWYRDADGQKSFNRLLAEILKLLEYSRLRISSIEPSDVNEGLADLMQHPRFCQYLHVPLQSGNSQILKQMKRSYRRETYYKRIELLKHKNPQVFLGTDVITGFPGEGEQEFQDSLSLLRDLEFAKVHAFPFSVRKGTRAEAMVDGMSREEKKRRVKILNEYSNSAYRNYGQMFLGQSREAILESDGEFLTDNYLKVKLKDPSQLQTLVKGQFVDIKLIDFEEEQKIGFQGEVNYG